MVKHAMVWSHIYLAASYGLICPSHSTRWHIHYYSPSLFSNMHCFSICSYSDVGDLQCRWYVKRYIYTEGNRVKWIGLADICSWCSNRLHVHVNFEGACIHVIMSYSKVSTWNIITIFFYSPPLQSNDSIVFKNSTVLKQLSWPSLIFYFVFRQIKRMYQI